MQYLRYLLIIFPIIFCIGASTMQIATLQRIPPAQPELPTPLPEDSAQHSFTIIARRISQDVFGKLQLEGEASVTMTDDEGSFVLQGDRIECLLNYTGMIDITAKGHATITNLDDSLTLQANRIHVNLLTDDIEAEGYAYCLYGTLMNCFMVGVLV